MVPFPRVMFCLAALVVCGAVLGACGDDKSGELQTRDASSLRNTLSNVEQRVDLQDCTGATQGAATFRQQVNDLPDGVGSKLKQALESSAHRLETLVADQCAAAEPAAPTDVPSTGTTSEDPAQGNGDNQTDQGNKDKKPKKEKPQKDETQTPTQPDTGGAGEEVPGVGNQGDGASPEG